MGLKSAKDQKRYLQILADGKIHERVDEDTEGAKIRTKKDQDGTEEDVLDKDGNEVYELTYPGLEDVTITKIQFREGYESNININIDMFDEDDNSFCLSLLAASNYGERFMEVLPNIDLNKPVEIDGYAFTPKGQTKKVRGVTIKQDGEKLTSAFAVKEKDEDWEVLVEGFPMPDAKKDYNKGERWKIFFAQRREWVMEYLEENEFILGTDSPETEDADDAEPEDDEEEEVEVKPKKKAVAKKAVKKTAKKSKKGDEDEDEDEAF